MTRKTKPSFFKVLIGADFSGHLRIPQAFRKYFDGKIPEQSYLRTPAGIFLVDVKNDNGSLFFQKGWKQFVRENDLKMGDFLVFRYSRTSGFFVVDIYGRHDCRKELEMAAAGSERPLEMRQGEQNKDDENLGSSNGGNKASVSVKSEPITCDSELEAFADVDDFTRNTKSRKTWALQPQVANNEAQAAALESANKYTSKHPCFKVVLTESYVTKGILHVPKTFMINSKIKKKTADLQVSNRLWTVKLKYNNTHCSFSQGWSRFVRENDLKAGDVCVFELVKHTEHDTVMKFCSLRCHG